MLLCYEIRNILEKRTYFSNVNSGSQSMGSTLEVLQGGAGRIDLNLVFSHRGGKTKILFSFFFSENFFFQELTAQKWGALQKNVKQQLVFIKQIS